MESLHKINSKELCKHLEDIYWECISQAVVEYRFSNRPFNSIAKEIIINDEELNKYIKFYRCYK